MLSVRLARGVCGCEIGAVALGKKGGKIRCYLGLPTAPLFHSAVRLARAAALLHHLDRGRESHIAGGSHRRHRYVPHKSKNHGFHAMGIRDHPVAARSPWQNGYVERLIGSTRRECLDHLVLFGEAHLRRILKTYASYYNQVRTHLSLDKDAPNSRRPQRSGDIAAMPILGGLHHQYVRI